MTTNWRGNITRLLTSLSLAFVTSWKSLVKRFYYKLVNILVLLDHWLPLQCLVMLSIADKNKEDIEFSTAQMVLYKIRISIHMFYFNRIFIGDP